MYSKDSMVLLESIADLAEDTQKLLVENSHGSEGEGNDELLKRAQHRLLLSDQLARALPFPTDDIEFCIG